MLHNNIFVSNFESLQWIYRLPGYYIMMNLIQYVLSQNIMLKLKPVGTVWDCQAIFL